jgi:hypothetical protein
MPSVVKRLDAITRIDMSGSTLRDDWVMVRKSDLETLIKAVQDSEAVAVMLSRLIREYDQDGRTLGRGFAAESNEVRRMLAANPRLIKRIQRIVQTGGQI